MPQPIIWNNKCYVDYYGELQLKSRFQLDLYVRGLNCIPKVFLDEDEPFGKEYKAGVLLVDKDRYFDIENRIKECFQHLDYSAKKIQYIYKLLKQLETENVAIEEKIIHFNTLSEEDYLRYEKLLIEVMSFMIVQWLSFDVSEMERISGKSRNYISSFATNLLYEPYQIRYEKSYLNIMKKENKAEQRQAAECFIREYAFLENFEIDRNSLEDIETLCAKVDRENGVADKERLLLQYEKARKKEFANKQRRIESTLSDLSGSDFEKFYNNLMLMRTCTDEEEERHYQQARAVRNIRWFLEKNNFDIYIGMDEIARYFNT